ncbi:MAG: adenosine deaminase [Treponema sp.]
MKESDFCSFLAEVPKAEIHIHIEAVLSMGSVKNLYQKHYGKGMSKQEETDLFSYDDLDGFIKAFLTVQNLFETVADLSCVFDDLANYLVKNGVVYCEAFFAPTAFLKKGFDYKEMVDLFSEEISRIKTEHNIIVKLLLDVSRTFGCENAMKNYELLKKYPCKDIIGIGLGGAESKGPPKEFEPVFTKAHKDGFHAVAHAGEDTGPESIWDSINFLHAERIGHGISSVQDPKLMDYLIQSQLPLEVCITSNVFTKKYVKKTEEHPVKEMFDNGVFVTINTDDPVFFRTTLLEEYWKCYSLLHFSMSEIKQLIYNSFNATFMDEAEKLDCISRVNAAWKKYSEK